jgi:hypothetical protein
MSKVEINNISVEDLKFLRRGDIKIIAEQSGTTIKTVWLFKNNKLKHSTCAPYFEAMIEKRKKEVQSKTA